MSTEESYGPINALAEHWARKGNGEIEKVQATLNLSRQLLANGEVKPYSEGENPFEPQPYPWESSEVSADIPLRLFLGTVSDLTSGQGHTVWFAAAPARSEDEFRRKLANHIGHTLANGAKWARTQAIFRSRKPSFRPNCAKDWINIKTGKGCRPSYFSSQDYTIIKAS